MNIRKVFSIILITSTLILLFQNCAPFESIQESSISNTLSSELKGEVVETAPIDSSPLEAEAPLDPLPREAETPESSLPEGNTAIDKLPYNEPKTGDDNINSGVTASDSLCKIQISNIKSTNRLTAIPTFHSVGLYWTPNDRNNSKLINVKFKECGTDKWRQGLNMIYNPINNVSKNPDSGKRLDREDFRGSLVNLKPNTTYIIELSVPANNETVQISSKTWSETLKIKRTINLRNKTFNTTLRYDNTISGSIDDGYVLIDGTGSTIDAAGKDNAIYLLNAKYIILRGFNIKNARQHAIRLEKSHFIVIEDNDISQWGSNEGSSNFSINNQAAIYTNRKGSSHNLVIQRNKIHNPNFGANNWTQLKASAMNKPSSEIVYSDRHPNGPVAIYLSNNYLGNNVIRYNEFSSPNNTKYFNDVMGGDANASHDGFPGPDSDIYGNYVSSAWDDGIEVEGGNANVRIWNNYIENTFIAIGNAAISIGPLYIWRNVTGESAQNHTNSPGYGYFLKMGYAKSEDWMTGINYVFNNTILQPNNKGYGGLGTIGSNVKRNINGTIVKNNILHVRDAVSHSISTRASKSNIANEYDFNFSNKLSSSPHEKNGIQGLAKYSSGTGSFDVANKIGRFSQASGSLGIDLGTIIPNFSDIFTGSKPDMGAFESSKKSHIYGIKSQE